MKSLNRTLSLVLVLVMVFGLFGVASATTFTDAASTQYKEAVDVMTGIGAINGYTDGTFKPTGTITREEAAKMVTFAVLGSEIASKLSVTATGFTDVDSARWSAPYIAYCVSRGIINGMGDGTFAPTANVTGYQLAKMMLCAAGYGKAAEFIGASWELNVAVSGNKNSVFTSAKTADFSKAATREEAALYVFNAITKTKTVTYSKTNEAYTPVPSGTHNINGDAYTQIVDDVYSTLTTSAATVGGCTGYTWKLGTTAISGFVTSDVTLATSTDGTSYANLTTNTSVDYIKFAADTSPAVTYYYNDGAASLTWPTADTVANNEAIIKGYAAIPGAIVKFLDTDTDGLYDKVSVTVKTVQALAAAPTTTITGSVTYVTVGTLANIPSTSITYPAGLAKNDVILTYQAASGMYYVEKASSVSGTVASYVDDTHVTINDTKYPASGLFLTGGGAANVAINDLEALLGKTGYTFYLDNGGNVCYVVVPTNTATVSNTFFVAATDTSSSFGVSTYKANVVKPDGTQAVVTVKKTSASNGVMTAVASTTAGSSANGNLGAGVFYTYAVNTDGTYNLTAAANQTINGTDLTVNTAALDAGDTSFVVKGNQPQFLGAVTATAATWNGLTPVYTASKVATSGTIFMYYDATAKTYTVKTGVANALSYAAGGTVTVLCDSTNTYAQIVICSGASSTSSASGYDQIFVTSGATVSADANSTVTYSYTAVVNGVIGKTVTSYSALTKGTLYFAKDYAANGVIVADAAVAGLIGTTHTALTNIAYTGSVMTVTGTPSASYILGTSCPIYLCNVTASGTSVSQITSDVADAMTYAGGNDTIVLIPTSATDATVAAVYIYLVA